MRFQFTRKAAAGALGLTLAASISTMAAAEDSPATIETDPVTVEQAVTPLATSVCTTFMTVGSPARWVSSIGSANTVANRKCQMGNKPQNTGAGVTKLQQALNHCHYYFNLAADGIYGNNTAAAVAAVQGGAGLKKDGLYGPKTHNVIRWDSPAHQYCLTDTVTL
jgi:murein L,D-transpeptidase YcbB/YkuD